MEFLVFPTLIKAVVLLAMSLGSLRSYLRRRLSAVAVAKKLFFTSRAAAGQACAVVTAADSRVDAVQCHSCND